MGEESGDSNRSMAGSREQKLTKNLDRGGAPQDSARPDYNVASELPAIIVDLDWREVEPVVCTYPDSVFK